MSTQDEEEFDDYLDGYDQCVACKSVCKSDEINENGVCEYCEGEE